MSKRAIVIVIDGLGVGELPDAAEYGDSGSNTLGNLSEAIETGLNLPNLATLGLGNIIPVKGVPPVDNSFAWWGKCAEKSKGKDTTTGHWELMGTLTERPLPTYPNGFPDEIIAAFEAAIGRKIIGNIVGSGTDIIDQYGEQHLIGGYPIVYTSADSVFQIAAHEEVIPTAELYEICEKARAILTGEHAVGRVIARPFRGVLKNFHRTAGRKDFSLKPPPGNVLELLSANEIITVGIGKIADIFARQNIARSIPVSGNEQGILTTLLQMNEVSEGFLFVNLVDTDSLYGHRNDVEGFRRALELFDKFVPHLQNAMREDDLLIITADHGIDPTTASTDHSREYVPVLCLRKHHRNHYGNTGEGNIGVRESFADIGATILKFFGIEEKLPIGTSLPIFDGTAKDS